jgi:Tol biopolymer transport system component
MSTDANGRATSSDVWSFALSPDGAHLAFSAWGRDLLPGVRDTHRNIYNKNIWTNAIERVTDSCCAVPNDHSDAPRYTPDGYGIGFTSMATNLVARDTNGRQDIFRRSLTSAAMNRLDVSAKGGQADGDASDFTFSPNGRSIAFVSSATNLVTGDVNGAPDVFVKDLVTGVVRRVSTSASEQQAYGSLAGAPVFLPDGKSIAFLSDARELVPDGWRNQVVEVFIKRLDTGAIRRACTNGNGEQLSDGCFKIWGTEGFARPSFTRDGRYMVMETMSNNVVAVDDGSKMRVYLKNLVTGGVRSLCLNAAGKLADGACWQPVLSPDGTRVLMVTDAPSMGAKNKVPTVVLKDLRTGAVTRVSTNPAGVDPNYASFAPQFSPDGTMIAFMSRATNLVPGGVVSGSPYYQIPNIYLVWLKP